MKQILIVFFSMILLLPPAKCLIPAADAQASGWVWGRGNTGAGVDAYAVATDGSGNVYGAGVNYEHAPCSFGAITVPNSSVTGTAGALGFIQSVWVKYSSTGTVLWADGTQNSDDWLYNITTDASGNLIVFGGFDSPTLTLGGTTVTNAYGSSGGNQNFIAKYSPTGTLLWVIADGNSTNTYHSFLGGVCILSTGGVVTDAAGNIYITSSFQKPSITMGSVTLTNTDPSGSTHDIFVAKYTPAGTLVWAKSAGGVSDDYAYGVALGAGGNIYVTGPFWSPSMTVGASTIANPYGGVGSFGGTPLAYIAEFSPTGTPLWAQGAGGSNGAYGMGVVSDPAGNVYMTGAFGDASITFGSTTVNRTYPGAAPNLALYLVQYSPANVVTWSKTIGSPSRGVWGFAIGLAACGEVWVSGNYSEPADVDGHTLALTGGGDPVFVAGYTLSGSVIGYSGLGSGGDDQNGIAVDPNGNVYICSDYIDFGSGFSIGPDVLTDSGGGEYLYIGKYANIAGTSDTTYRRQDTVLCGSGIVTLNAPGGYGNYTWDNATNLVTRDINTTGTYWVVCASTCAIPVVIDTFNVTITPAGNSTTTTNMAICSGAGSVTLIADPGFGTYTWNTGSTGLSEVATTPGIYWVHEVNACATRTDTFNVNVYPPLMVTASSDVKACNSLVDLLCPAPGTSTYKYAWSGPVGFTSTVENPSITNVTAAVQGVYSVIVTDNTTGCAGGAITTVTLGPVGFQLTGITPPQTINYGGSVQLNADNGVFYWWMPNDGTLDNRNINNPIASPLQKTIYTVYAMDSAGCRDTAQIIVDVIFDSVTIPSAFTPNGDGLNDIFRPIGMKYQKLIEFSVYNRWGQQIFTTVDKAKGWDGSFSGVLQDLGVYQYVLIVAMADGENRVFKGNVTLIR